VKRFNTLLVTLFVSFSVFAAEVSIEACVSTVFTEKSTNTDVAGFASTCYTLEGAATLDENINFKSASDAENRDFMVGLCNLSGSTQQYTARHELKYTINKTADMSERVDAKVKYGPIEGTATEGEGTLTAVYDFEEENGLCADYVFELSSSYKVFAGISPDRLTSQQDLNGVFYDPANSGHGFDFNLHEFGLTVYYYGHTKDGERLWLISEVHTDEIRLRDQITLNMYEIAEGTFGAPGDVTAWGTLNITWEDCNSGYVTLDGVDGQMNMSIVRIVGLPESACQGGLSTVAGFGPELRSEWGQVKVSPAPAKPSGA
jgi:hypothetical protein